MPFTAIGFAQPCCIAREGLGLSEKAEKLRRYIASGFVGSCAGSAKRYSFKWNGLTIYLCERHGQQAIARAK